jgi:hypothetical protein
VIFISFENQVKAYDLNFFSDQSYLSSKKAQEERNIYTKLKNRQIEFEDILSIFSENYNNSSALQEISSKSISSFKLETFKNGKLNFDYVKLIALQSIKYNYYNDPLVVKYEFFNNQWHLISTESKIKLGKYEHRMKFNGSSQKLKSFIKNNYRKINKNIDSIDTILKIENLIFIKNNEIKSYSLFFKESLNQKNGWLLYDIQEQAKNNLGNFIKNQRVSQFSFKNNKTQNHLSENELNLIPKNKTANVSISCNKYANGYTIYFSESQGRNLKDRIKVQNNSIIELLNTNFKTVYSSCHKYIYYNIDSNNPDKIMVIKGSPNRIKYTQLKYSSSDKVTKLEFIEN